ncbi:glycosyl hydrolase [Micromonospora sp. MED01]|uniref:F510_1955 family glycosylhydrolase n=1 Tax=Micromonospora alfalfae TaxID=2911212 RepID=UPI001EE8BB19|nr:glycosyl hydrolase [Micromonospora alfalfae]MCG5466595.1 glycosyl hydrolase [Micromonospora alfalfae]
MPGERSNRMTWAGTALGVALLIAAVIAFVNWDDASRSSDVSTASALSHVHGMAVNPSDQQLYVATHHGVVRVSDSGAAHVGDGRQDTMGFTVIGPDHFLASGHPAPGEAGPTHLGLIESTDGGRTWRSVSLAGRADFHALRSADGVTYGVDSSTGSLLASTDRVTWQARSRIEAYDLAVEPGQPDSLLATAEQGLQRSVDGGRTWAAAGGRAFVLLHWAGRDRLLGIAADGQILVSHDAAVSWSGTGGHVPDAPAAFTTHGDLLFVATRDGRVLRSGDAGATWQPMQTSLS